MWLCILVTSSGVIFIGGRWSHPLWLRAVSVCVSGCRSETLSPCISIGLNPVCALMSSFNDSCRLADAISIRIVSCVGGCMLMGSGV